MTHRSFRSSAATRLVAMFLASAACSACTLEEIVASGLEGWNLVLVSFNPVDGSGMSGLGEGSFIDGDKDFRLTATIYPAVVGQSYVAHIHAGSCRHRRHRTSSEEPSLLRERNRPALRAPHPAGAAAARPGRARRGSPVKRVKGMPEGGPGRGEQPPQVAASDPAEAASAPARSQRTPGGRQRTEVTERGPGRPRSLGQEQSRRRPQAGERDPDRQEGRGTQRAPGKRDLTPLSPVAPQRHVCRKAGRASTVDRCRSLTQAGPWHDHDAVAGQLRPPAEVEVITELPERRVETVEQVVDVTADEHSRGADPQDVAVVVVLPLIGLASGGTTDPTAGAVNH